MSLSSSSASITNEQKRDWLDLPSDVTTNILKRIGVVDILENAQKVCTAWHKICKDPAMWKVIQVISLSSHATRLCKKAVDRSHGQLVDITIRSVNEELLSYVAKRSTQLKRLEIIFYVHDNYTRIPEALRNFPLLEELNFYLIELSKEAIEIAGRYCPMLRTLKVNQKPCDWVPPGFQDDDEVMSTLRLRDDDDVAIAIGENLHELRHLELIGNDMSNTGLQTILDGCLRLETLDLRNCFSINLDGDLGKRCVEQIKNLKLPDDSLEGSPHNYIYEDSESDDVDCCVSDDDDYY